MEGTTQSYANKYFNIKPVDAVISVYDASALGNYSTSQYEAGYEKQNLIGLAPAVRSISQSGFVVHFHSDIR